MSEPHAVAVFCTGFTMQSLGAKDVFDGAERY
jgi:hypothetical protein